VEDLAEELFNTSGISRDVVASGQESGAGTRLIWNAESPNTATTLVKKWRPTNAVKLESSLKFVPYLMST
jgi:hypothetical protein